MFSTIKPGTRPRFYPNDRVVHANERIQYGPGTYIEDADSAGRPACKGRVQFDADPAGAPRTVWLDDLAPAPRGKPGERPALRAVELPNEVA